MKWATSAYLYFLCFLSLQIRPYLDDIKFDLEVIVYFDIVCDVTANCGSLTHSLFLDHVERVQCPLVRWSVGTVPCTSRMSDFHLC